MAKHFKQPSTMSAQKHFSQVPAADIPRSKFDRSHNLKTTFDAGLLIPIFCDEVLPGDTFHMNSTQFARLATPLHPIMDNMFLDVHYWFVPNRLVWDHWQEFMGERRNPDDDPNDYSVPVVSVPVSGTKTDSQVLSNYFGLPRLSAAASDTMLVNALPFRAYNLIYNEWYRDQNLQARAYENHGDGPDSYIGNYPILRRGKRKDYFTGALPWPQKGDPVTIPFGTTAPVYGTGSTPFDRSDTDAEIYISGQDPDNNLAAFYTTLGSPFNPDTLSPGATPDTEYIKISENRQVLFADLAEATAITINDLRTAFQIQKLLERDARGGTRYIELIQSHFGVTSDDARLQRPEYLGGGQSRINITPTPSTVHTDDAPQANLAGVGTSLGNGRFTKSFTEHGHVIGLVSARADLTYQRGIERMWSRSTRYDYYWPALAHLGEQAILNKEINYRGNSAPSPTDDEVFGYQERYAEYRYKPSRITGLFNSDCQTSLDVWHLAQDFSNAGAVPLNGSFIQDNPPIDRVIAVPDEPHFLLDVWFDYKCDRPMPVYSVPGLVDHF